MLVCFEATLKRMKMFQDPVYSGWAVHIFKYFCHISRQKWQFQQFYKCGYNDIWHEFLHLWRFFLTVGQHWFIGTFGTLGHWDIWDIGRFQFGGDWCAMKFSNRNFRKSRAMLFKRNFRIFSKKWSTIEIFENLISHLKHIFNNKQP